MVICLVVKFVIVNILNEAYNQTKLLYLSHKDLIEIAYQKMLTNVVISKEEIEALKNGIF